MTAILPRKWLVGKSMVLLSAVLQGIASSQYPSTRSLQGKRSEDRIVCKIGFVESFSPDPCCSWGLGIWRASLLLMDLGILFMTVGGWLLKHRTNPIFTNDPIFRSFALKRSSTRILGTSVTLQHSWKQYHTLPDKPFSGQNCGHHTSLAVIGWPGRQYCRQNCGSSHTISLEIKIIRRRLRCICTRQSSQRTLKIRTKDRILPGVIVRPQT